MYALEDSLGVVSQILILIFVFIHICHFVPSQLVCISRFFVKITMAMLMGANFHKFTRMEVKYLKKAIYNKILKLLSFWFSSRSGLK